MKKKSTRKKTVTKKTATKKRAVATRPPSEVQRLQRAMATAGFGSRRECEAFIEEGRVEVDGKIVNKLGTKVDPFKQKIFVDGQKLTMPRLKYFMLNKPPGIVSTSKDPSGRVRVIDLIKTDQRVYNVGRLDQSSEGLILVTNDGDLANQLTHPRYGVEKKYLVQVHGTPTGSALKSLTQGVYLAEGKARVANIKFKRRTKDTSWLEIVLDEGRNREIRRLLASVGHKVLRLRRIAIGPLRLGELPIGAHRELTTQEVRALRKAATGPTGRRRRFRKKPAGSSSVTGRDKQHSKLAKKKKSRTKSATRSKKSSEKSKGRAAARSSGKNDFPGKKRAVKRTSKKRAGPTAGKKRTKKRGRK